MESKFAQRLFEIRKERGLTQDAIAKAIGVSQKAIDFWEKGINEPKASYVAKLAIFFAITTDYLLGLTDE